ncbi:heavy-metal-associated domain-containing protein [Algoriphagus formosus]|uniref:heavy-metal-associated domain-containing protein n=1 Tax=Algoriphagus formosus TaxID=2007308 RepID=UPI001E4402C5|nr:heavy-metal-associated domain-containing protein [Algoriphagus formosus]
MITKTYKIEGMTCGGCVASVKKQLDESDSISDANIRLDFPQAKISFVNELGIETLQSIINKAGNYTIKLNGSETQNTELSLPEKNVRTFKPLLLIVGFIAVVSALTQFPFSSFSGMLWMRHFMAGFFIVFAFFKLLNLQGFANSYSMYDIVAAKWKSWGYVYPFVELALGLLYLTNIAPLATNISTALILGISSIGVIKSNLNKKKIKCACLGDVFNLPMSTVTIVEDLSMVGMSLIMLFQYQII